MHLASERCERLLALQQRRYRRVAHRKYDSRTYKIKLPVQKRYACIDLILQRRPVGGWATLHDVADEDFIPLQIDRPQNIRQQLSSTSDEWTSSLVLARAGAFTHDHQSGIAWAFAGYRVRARLAEPTPRAFADCGRNLFEVQGG
jgi:hypothetical protein